MIDAYFRQCHSAPKIAYVASQYTDHDPAVMDLRYKLACSAVRQLIGLFPSVFFYSPIAHYHTIAVLSDLPRDAEYWGVRNRLELSFAAVLVVVHTPTVLDSRGVRTEVAFARSAGKGVFLFDPETQEMINYG